MVHSIRFDSMNPEIPIIHTNEIYFQICIQMNTEHKTLSIHGKEFVHIDSLVFDSCCRCRRCLIYYYSSLSIAWMICFIFGRSPFKYIQNWLMFDFMRNENDFHTKIGLIYPTVPKYPDFQERKDRLKSSKLQEFQTDATFNVRRSPKYENIFTYKLFGYPNEWRWCNIQNFTVEIWRQNWV